MHQPLVSLPSGLGLLCVSGRLSKTDGTRRWILPSNRNQTTRVLLWLHERHKQAEQLTNLHGWQTTWISHATNSTSPSQVDVAVTAEPVCKHVVWILDWAKTWDFWVKEKFIFIFNVHFVPLALVSSTLPYLFCIHYYICLTWTYLTYTCGDRNKKKHSEINMMHECFCLCVSNVFPNPFSDHWTVTSMGQGNQLILYNKDPSVAGLKTLAKLTWIKVTMIHPAQCHTISFSLTYIALETWPLTLEGPWALHLQEVKFVPWASLGLMHLRTMSTQGNNTIISSLGNSRDGK